LSCARCQAILLSLSATMLHSSNQGED